MSGEFFVSILFNNIYLLPILWHIYLFPTVDCCVKRETWCMSTDGLACVGQDEVVILLETLPNEKHPPRDIFLFVNNLYKNASTG